MKEIIDAAKKIKCPIIDVKIAPHFLRLSQEEVEKVYRRLRLKIERTYLDHIVKYYQEVYSKGGCFLVVRLDEKKIEEYKI
jgi:hypothetical protein